ncbi:PAS domain S-box protein [Nocardioides sp. W3-2-3]|nr:PAS domain S-box protein [Nocardioides convexus]
MRTCAIAPAYQAESAARPMGAGRDLYGLRSDGTEVPIEIGLNPIVIGEEKFVLASVIDISERLAVQDALAVAGKDSLRRSILASMTCSVLVTDLEGQIVAANPATERLLGFPETALLGRSLTRLLRLLAHSRARLDAGRRRRGVRAWRTAAGTARRSPSARRSPRSSTRTARRPATWPSPSTSPSGSRCGPAWPTSRTTTH